MEGLYQTIRHKVYQNLDVGHDITDDELYQVIDRCIYEASREKIISIRQKEELRSRLYNSIKKLDILQELLDDDEITEIMVNGTKCIFYEKQGRIKKWDRQFESEEKLADIAQRIAAMSNRMVNEASPIVDTRLNDGSRVNIVLPPVAIDGPVITIRKFYDTPLTIERLIELGSITPEASCFLEKLVKSRYNIFISGGTGSGKTTFLNVLSDYIPSDERVITIEDSAELQLHNISNMVRLEARMANAEGGNAVSIRDLIKSSLRMRPEGIKIKKGKSEHNKKSFPIPLAFLQYIPGNSIPLISGKIIKIIKEADDLIPLFHSILIFHSSSPLFSRLAGHFSLQVIVFTI